MRDPMETKSTNGASSVKLESHGAKEEEDKESYELYFIGRKLKLLEFEVKPKPIPVMIPTGWSIARHPKIQIREYPYLVNLGGEFGGLTRKGDVQLRVRDKRKPYRCVIYHDRPNRRPLRLTCNLGEVMAATFYEGYDQNKHYIFYRDGELVNCAWENLVVCDLPTYQSLNIARLEKLYPSEKFAILKYHVSTSCTFDMHIISNTGRLYSTLTQQFLSRITRSNKYYGIYCNSPRNGCPRYHEINVYRAVMHNFTDHLGIDLDGFDTPQKRRVKLRTVVMGPLPAITSTTRWRTVGIIPWTKLSFSNYEVSDAGHVRVKGTNECIEQHISATCTFPKVKMICDKIVTPSDECVATDPKWHYIRVGRLVANAFIGNYSSSKLYIKYRNGDNKDNRVENLQWVFLPSSRIKPCPVLVTLVGAPNDKKQFRSLRQAGLHIPGLIIDARKIRAAGNQMIQEVNWDGEIRSVVVQML